MNKKYLLLIPLVALLSSCQYIQKQSIGGSDIETSGGGNESSSTERETPSDYSDSFEDIESEEDDRNTSKTSETSGSDDSEESSEITTSDLESLVDSISAFYIKPEQFSSVDPTVESTIYAVDDDDDATNYSFLVYGISVSDSKLIFSDSAYIKSSTPLTLDTGEHLKSVICYLENWEVSGLSPLKYLSGNSLDTLTTEVTSISLTYDNKFIDTVTDDITEDYLSIQINTEYTALATQSYGYTGPLEINEFIFAFQEE